jgi:hypothetical protein
MHTSIWRSSIPLMPIIKCETKEAYIETKDLCWRYKSRVPGREEGGKGLGGGGGGYERGQWSVSIPPTKRKGGLG